MRTSLALLLSICISSPFYAAQSTTIIIYDGTSPLGDIYLAVQGDVYQVVTKSADVPRLTRGLKIQKNADGRKDLSSEFSEEKFIHRDRQVRKQ